MLRIDNQSSAVVTGGGRVEDGGEDKRAPTTGMGAASRVC